MREVISIRQVGCKRGFPYYAVGLYRPIACKRDGVVTYRLIQNLSGWSRSCRPEYFGIKDDPRYIPNIRHGSKVL